MKIAELLRTLADLVDAESLPEPQLSIANVEIAAQNDEMDQLVKLAGITQASTTPEEEIFPVQAVIPAGNDFHYSKNPADMRTDSISLYPGYGARD